MVSDFYLGAGKVLYFLPVILPVILFIWSER